MKMESRYYPGVEVDITSLMTSLRDLFDEDFEVQSMQVSSTAVLQAPKSSTLRESTGRCGTCGAAATAGSAFCSSCGANLRVGLACASCGAVQKDQTARFCNACGKPLAATG